MYRATRVWSWSLMLGLGVSLGTIVGAGSLAAQPKRKEPLSRYPVVSPDQIQETSVKIRLKGKKPAAPKKRKTKRGGKKRKAAKAVTVKIRCYQGEPGQVRRAKSGDLHFISYDQFIKEQKKLLKKVKRKAQLAIKNSIERNIQINKAGGTACPTLAVPPAGEPGGPALPNEPIVNSSLKPYTGPFGPEQARILGERFCFSLTPTEVDRAVSEGLEATIIRFQNWSDGSRHISFPGNPLVSQLVTDARCDGYLKGEELDGSDDSAEEDCNPRNPWTDLDVSGTRYRMYLEIFGTNCYHAKVAAFLSDERLAPTMAFASSNSRYRHLAPAYLSDLWEAARSGDYKQYIKDIFIPTQGSGYASAVLNVVGNRDPNIPNEDGARELLELGTVGSKRLDETLNYDSTDIANNALAFTGWVWSDLSYEVGEDEPITISSPSFSSQAFVNRDKVLFGADPANRTVIKDMNDSIEAAFKHPETSVELAERVCKEFITSRCSKAMVLEIARWITEANFNLNTVLARVMRSEALYSNETKDSLIKHPMEYFLGFLRTIEFPVGKEPFSLRDIEGRLLERTGQRAFLPPTIFGFYEDELAGEGRVLDRRRACMETMSNSPQELEEKLGYSIRNRFMTNLPQAESDSLAVVDKLASTLNVRLTAEQRNAADTFLNYYLDSRCENWEVDQGYCSTNQVGQEYLRRDVFDLRSNAWKYVERVQGLLVMFCQKFDYQTK